MLKLPEGILSGPDHQRLAEEREKLLEFAKKQNIAKPEVFTKVREAAIAEEIFEEFGSVNKLLSKFAHPTAVNVFVPEVDHDLNRLFYNLGLGLAELAIGRAENPDNYCSEHLRRTRRPTSSSEFYGRSG